MVCEGNSIHIQDAITAPRLLISLSAIKKIHRTEIVDKTAFITGGKMCDAPKIHKDAQKSGISKKVREKAYVIRISCPDNRVISKSRRCHKKCIIVYSRLSTHKQNP